MKFWQLFLGTLLWMQWIGISVVTAQPTSNSWMETSRYSAPEAIQAAAADHEYFFAVNNSQIAKYDRRSGTRVAISSGEAKHLNSGFLHEGHLYCAHSNYPQKPEQSQIMMLDLDTMKLSTWKDFGNFGGSLTWAIFRSDSWWCNFARYGADNHQTFLVQFDRDWNEKSRWTYPREVTSELGRYSLSGGIWRDSLLLVTGHDERVLYRLELPATGNVLKLIDKQSIPFTGQGIADDPKTGGLIGIDRRKRQVVFAVQ